MKRIPVSGLALGISALTLCAVTAGSFVEAQAPQTTRPAAPRTAAPATTAATATTPQAPRPAAPKAAATPVASAALNETVKTYCVGCHNEKVHRGELSLAAFDVAKAADHADVAEKMVRKLRTGMMPPREASRKPDADTRLALVTALETTLDAAATTHANPGHRLFQRLNRAEYSAAIRSLFGLDIDVSTYLPADTISASFDNIADVQMPSATVMQGYLRAAAQVSRVA